MLERLEKMDDTLMKGVDFIIVASLGFLCFTIALQIFNRFVTQVPLPWTEEYAKYTFVWLSMFGSAKALREKSHIFVDIMDVAVKGKAAWWCAIAADTVCLAFFVIFVWVSLPWCLSNFDVGTEAIPEIPMGAFYLAVPAGAILMLIFQIELFWRHVTSPVVYKEEEK